MVKLCKSELEFKVDVKSILGTATGYAFRVKSINTMTIEKLRLAEARDKKTPWKKWGPYLSERQWGTVREDYSENGDAWNFFTHDQARSRAYR